MCTIRWKALHLWDNLGGLTLSSSLNCFILLSSLPSCSLLYSKLNLPKHRGSVFQSVHSFTLTFCWREAPPPSTPQPSGGYGDLTSLQKVNAGTPSIVRKRSQRAWNWFITDCSLRGGHVTDIMNKKCVGTVWWWWGGEVKVIYSDHFTEILRNC